MSIDDRLEFLRGLMDTDGSCSDGSIEFSTSYFGDDFKRLLNELGIKYTVKERIPFYKKNGKKIDGKISSRFHIYTNIPLFKIPYKLENQFKKTKKENEKQRTFRNFNSIVNVEKIEDDYATCIRVDNQDKLFLTNDCIVTHNSNLIDVFNAAKATLEGKGWTVTG